MGSAWGGRNVRDRRGLLRSLGSLVPYSLAAVRSKIGQLVPCPLT
jgi:hypothetical protein